MSFQSFQICACNELAFDSYLRGCHHVSGWHFLSRQPILPTTAFVLGMGVYLPSTGGSLAWSALLYTTLHPTPWFRIPRGYYRWNGSFTWGNSWRHTNLGATVGQDGMREHLLGSIGWGFSSVGLGSDSPSLRSCSLCSSPAPSLRSRLLEVVPGAAAIVAGFVRVRALNQRQWKSKLLFICPQKGASAFACWWWNLPESSVNPLETFCLIMIITTY